MRTPRQSLRGGRLQGMLERLLGLFVAAAALVPLMFLIAGIRDLLSTGLSSVALLFAIPGALVLVWCTHTSWRLITGRPRKDGGLLSPGVIALAGIGIAAKGIFGLVTNGWRAVPEATVFLVTGITTVSMAWTRVRRQHGASDPPPNHALHPTAASDRERPRVSASR